MTQIFKRVRKIYQWEKHSEFWDRVDTVMDRTHPPSPGDFTASVAPDERIFFVSASERLYCAIKTNTSDTLLQTVGTKWASRQNLKEMIKILGRCSRLAVRDAKKRVTGEEIEAVIMRSSLETARKFKFAVYGVDVPHTSIPDEGLVVNKITI